ncbi:MAG: isoprenylcysteine carboxylmethyltransferase family protein [Mycobacterium sp.]|nr:isoprenylcysteine carboxylmethyltransferase family protein [Mycobacterium sp.]MBV8291403.1 isoprenylcysteine carboxylmethyltransferase family protein [Mycobacterium sp.]
MLLWTMAQVIILAALIFIPAWTIRYWQAWVFLIVWAVCVYVMGMYLGINDPALLQRRRKWEQRPAQRAIASLEILSFNALWVVSGLDHRFRWSHVPPIVSVVGDLLVGLGLFVVLVVFRANTYGGSNVEVVEGQTVISTGPYAIVRHPMYAAAVVMAMGMPLALGSWWGLLAVVGLIATLVWRIFDEEKLLRDDLPGYAEYTQHVRYRLAPFVW